MNTQIESEITKIGSLRPRMDRISVKLKIIDKSRTEEIFSRNRETHRVANATGGDETALVNISLWDENIARMVIGKTYLLENVYTKLYRGLLQLKLGRHSRISETDDISSVNKDVDMSADHSDSRRRSYDDDEVDYRRYREYAPGIGRIGQLDN
jgi:ssDNA-binding replication factor A large subunit